MVYWLSMTDHLLTGNFFWQVKQLQSEIIASSNKPLSVGFDSFVIKLKGFLFF
jgi:hypothetical protein